LEVARPEHHLDAVETEFDCACKRVVAAQDVLDDAGPQLSAAGQRVSRPLRLEGAGWRLEVEARSRALLSESGIVEGLTLVAR
jgi:hypothetical protein